MLVEMVDDTFEAIKDLKHKDYGAVILGFVFDVSSLSAGSSLKIESVTLSVNGESTTLDLKDRITFNKISARDETYYCTSVYSTNVPVVLFSEGQNISSVSFNYRSEHKAVIEGFEFNDYINIADSTVFVDNAALGSIDEAFPLTLEADQALCIVIDGDFGKHNSFSDFYVNSLLSYTSEEDGSKKLKDYIAVQAVGNSNDLKNLIDQVVG